MFRTTRSLPASAPTFFVDDTSSLSYSHHFRKVHTCQLCFVLTPLVNQKDANPAYYTLLFLHLLSTISLLRKIPSPAFCRGFSSRRGSLFLHSPGQLFPFVLEGPFQWVEVVFCFPIQLKDLGDPRPLIVEDSIPPGLFPNGSS